MKNTFKLELAKTELTPFVLIDEEKGYMYFEGESYHENVISFFSQVNEWLNEFLKTDFDTLTFDCELSYFSSSTVKVLLNMLLEMDNCKNPEKIIVNWITIQKNRIIIECGEDFKDELKNIAFNIVLRD